MNKYFLNKIEYLENKDQNYFRDVIWLYLLFFSSVIIHYYFPFYLKYVALLILVVWIIKTKNTELMYAYILLFTFSPGNLLYRQDPIHPMPYIPFFGKEILIDEIILFALLAKTFKKKNNIKYDIYFYLFPAYAIFLFLFGILLGTNLVKIFASIRYCLPFLLLFILPKLLDNKNSYDRLFLILQSTILLIVAAQLFAFISGTHPLIAMGGRYALGADVEEFFNADYELVRPLYSTGIIMLNVISGIYFLFHEDLNKKVRLFISIGLILNIYSIVITGTRGYSFAVLIMTLLFMFSYKKKIVQSLSFFVFSLLLIFIFLRIFPVAYYQFQLSFERLLTIQYLLEGDETAGNTLIRLTERMPVVMDKVKESLIFGYGFSDIYYRYKDGHVGNQNLLLNGGLVGFILYYLFVFKIILKSIKNYFISKQKLYLTFLVGIIGYTIVHSVTYMMFNYLIGTVYLHYSILTFFSFYNTIFNRVNIYDKQSSSIKSN